jgi:hypothetical protein
MAGRRLTREGMVSSASLHDSLEGNTLAGGTLAGWRKGYDPTRSPNFKGTLGTGCPVAQRLTVTVTSRSSLVIVFMTE